MSNPEEGYEQEIKRLRSLMQKHHPDKGGDANEFNRIRKQLHSMRKNKDFYVDKFRGRSGRNYGFTETAFVEPYYPDSPIPPGTYPGMLTAIENTKNYRTGGWTITLHFVIDQDSLYPGVMLKKAIHITDYEIQHKTLKEIKEANWLQKLGYQGGDEMKVVGKKVWLYVVKDNARQENRIFSINLR